MGSKLACVSSLPCVIRCISSSKSFFTEGMCHLLDVLQRPTNPNDLGGRLNYEQSLQAKPSQFNNDLCAVQPEQGPVLVGGQCVIRNPRKVKVIGDYSADPALKPKRKDPTRSTGRVLQ